MRILTYRMVLTDRSVSLSAEDYVLWVVEIIGDRGVVTQAAHWALHSDVLIATLLADNITAAIEPCPTVPSLIDLYTDVTLIGATVNVTVRHYAKRGKVIVEIG